MVSDGSSSISVAVRVRPFTIREAAQLSKTDDGPFFLGDGALAGGPPKLAQKGIRPIIKVVDERCLVFDPPEDNPVQKFSRSVVPMGKRTKDQMFAFDRVFDENTTQNDVYEVTAKSLLNNVMDGYNATVFAYGATGCGKTHTITGTLQQPGIIFLTMQELFERINDVKEDKVTEISLSFLEIYNETIRDLLVPGGSKQGLSLREDANQAVSVSGLSSHHPSNVDEVMEMIVRGNECRTMSPTEANATSSRSHAVLQINVAQKDRAAGTNEPHTMATLSIIDLAGSERASATKNRGEQLKEGANINKSLLALGSCINALCDPRRRNHIPYRDSKLTRLLKFSLGGNCKTVMIVCVSPSSIHYDETQNTLRYANRAKNIQTKVTRNVFNVNRHVKDFLKKIDEQMTLINELKSQQKDYENVAFTKLRKQNEKREAIVREGLGRLRNSYDHSQGDRHERINSMKKLRQIEKRISMINTWMVAFDNVCEAREEEDPPRTLLAMRKTAQGILVELESSRHHYHQRLSKSTWQRAIDTALSVGIDQLRAVEGGVEPLEMASLEREAELLKTNAERELHMAVLEQEKVGDAGLMHVLLTAHFETVAIINQLMYMEEREAVTAARGLLNKMLASCADATSHLIRPDGSMPITQPLPPTKSGTPRRTKTINLMGPSPKKPIVPAVDEMRRMTASPTKGSPRKRAVLGVARRGVSFTPKRTPSKRAVRWRDDTQEGALAEYEKTPQHMKATPPQPGVAPLQERDTLPLSRIPAPFGDRSSPSHIRLSSSPITAPPTACSQLSPENRPPQASSDRFKAGFLSRKSNDSPVPPTLSALPASSSPDPSPLSESTSSRVNARSSLERYRSSISSAQPHHAASSSGNDSSSGSGSDSERDVEGTGRTSWIPSNDSDAAKIKAAVKRASLSRSSSQRTQRRRSPSTASAATGTGSSPPRGSDGAVIAGSAKRLAERDAAWRHSSVLSPRTTAAAVQKPAGRRATTIMNDERLLGRSATRGHARASTSITAPTLASAQRASINGRPGSAGTWR